MSAAPDAGKQLLRPRDIQQIYGWGAKTLWRWERAGKFPSRVTISARCVGWLREDIDAWLAAKPRGIAGSASAGREVTP